MRILFIADKLTGGAGNVAQQLASCLSQEQDNTIFLMIETNVQPKYDLSKVCIINREIDSPKINNPVLTIKRYLSSVIWLNTTIKSCKPDVIISFLNSVSTYVLMSQWFTKTPIIVSERSNPYQEWSKLSIRKKIQWYIAYRRSNMIVYQFKCFEPFFKFAYRKHQTCAIPNMIFDSVDCFSHKDSDNQINFASVATLYPVKRIDLMIDIFAELKKRHSNIVLNIYGDGPDRNKLENQVKLLQLQDTICFHGHVPNSRTVLCRNDILLMTSEREGFPNVIIEAMSIGVPTVTFKYHEGLCEIITDGINGFLIEQNNIKTFVEKLDYIVSHPQIIIKLRENGVNVCHKYDRDKVLRLWNKCIESVIKH